MVGQGAVEETLIESCRTAATKIFDALVFDQMLDENANVIRLSAGNPVLQPYNKRVTRITLPKKTIHLYRYFRTRQPPVQALSKAGISRI